MADVTLLADLSIPGDLDIDIGVFYLNGFNLTVGGTLTINGVIKVQGAEIITINTVPLSVNKLDVHADVVLGAAWGIEFAGASAGIAIPNDYATVFFNLTVGSGKVHNFTEGALNEITINGVFDSTGDLQVPATLRSTTDGVEWFIKLNGTSELEDGVDVKDSNAASGAIIWARDSIDSGNTTNWNLTATFSTIGNSTWGEILFKIRSRLNEPTEGFFIDEELMCYWNQVQLFFARETQFFKTELLFDIETSITTPEEFFLDLPENFLGLIGVGLQPKDSAEITWLQRTNLAGRSTKAAPDQAFFIRDRNRLVLSKTVDPLTINLLIKFYKAPIPFVDETDLDRFSDVYDDYTDDIILGVVAICLLKRLDFESYRLIKQEYENRIRLALKAEGRRQGNRQIQVLE